ncbi:2-hydroxyacid dehydrogenase [Paraburkholderia tropica]|uniref:2-hydroxyacid dehydrogenase n=1 Tax=Paraburkholderia tropica TaxID=92647 RepID=UPI001591B0C2|nr:2-hydroxyacid dehydrogenase [Paraburkholderia tropica]
MKPDVLLLNPLLPEIDARLRERYTVHNFYECDDKSALVDNVGERIRGVVTGGATGIKQELMQQLPSLEIVAVNGIGTDAVDLDYAHARGIHVSTTPGVLTDDVADLAIGLLIACARGLCTGDQFVRRGHWGKTQLPFSRRFSGMRVGIVGLGRVGRAIAVRAAAFGCPIHYTDIQPISDTPYRYFDNIHELASNCDALILAASADNAKAIVDATVLRSLGENGYLINVARGRLVNEPELVAALKARVIAGAGLDVFVDEPNVPNELLDMDNVVFQPHRGSATVETRRAMGDIVLASLDAALGRKAS